MIAVDDVVRHKGVEAAFDAIINICPRALFLNVQRDFDRARNAPDRGRFQQPCALGLEALVFRCVVSDAVRCATLQIVGAWRKRKIKHKRFVRGYRPPLDTDSV